MDRRFLFPSGHRVAQPGRRLSMLLHVMLAQIADAAGFAFGISCGAAVAAVENQDVVGANPAVFRDIGHQGFFGMQNVVLVNQADSVADTLYMGINGDVRLTESVGEDDVGGFSADSREFYSSLI